MISVTSASRYITSALWYHPRYQSRSSMFIRGLIPRNFAELAEAVPIETTWAHSDWYLRHSFPLYVCTVPKCKAIATFQTQNNAHTPYLSYHIVRSYPWHPFIRQSSIPIPVCLDKCSITIILITLLCRFCSFSKSWFHWLETLWLYFRFSLGLSCVCYAVVCFCSLMSCGHLLGKGWPLCPRLWCLIASFLLSHWHPGSNVVLDCNDYWSLSSFLLSFNA